MELPRELREALDITVAAAPARAVGATLAATVDRLIERYRAGGPATDEPILNTLLDVLAYAAYRMPATYAAVRLALAQLRRAAPALSPRTLLDVGGGTGAASWAAVDAFPGLTSITVLDRVDEALALGRRLAGASPHPGLRSATWQPARLDAPTHELGAVAPEGLVLLSYVLGELTDADQATLVERAAASLGPTGTPSAQGAGAVVVVEPGTPAGYGRVLAARDRLLAAGFRVAAPCPHQRPCPIVAGRDWCHFSARINRSALHRRVKGAELSYEDEKFSYVAAVRGTPVEAPVGRVLRHPTHRKGLVVLRVCTVDDGITPENVPKSRGERYRAARDISWGDGWPAAAEKEGIG